MFLIYLAGVAWGAIAGYIAFAFALRARKKFIDQLRGRIEELYVKADAWRKVAGDRLPGRRPLT
jgi:hypothetical protein